MTIILAEPPSVGRKVERGLLRLAYVSDAASGLCTADLEAIETASLARNRAAGLTGLLVFQEGRFGGFLEGPRRRVFACMERIIVDPRHRGVQTLLETDAFDRRFEGWSFGQLPLATGVDAFVGSLSRRLA